MNQLPTIPEHTIFTCHICAATQCLCDTCRPVTRAGIFVHRKEPERTMCSSCYYKAYRLKKPDQDRATKNRYLTKQKEIVKAYQLTPAYTEMQLELFKLKIERRWEVTVKRHELQLASLAGRWVSEYLKILFFFDLIARELNRTTVPQYHGVTGFGLVGHGARVCRSQHAGKNKTTDLFWGSGCRSRGSSLSV